VTARSYLDLILHSARTMGDVPSWHGRRTCTNRRGHRACAARKAWQPDAKPAGSRVCTKSAQLRGGRRRSLAIAKRRGGQRKQMGTFRANPGGRGLPGDLLCHSPCEYAWLFDAARFAHLTPESHVAAPWGFASSCWTAVAVQIRLQPASARRHSSVPELFPTPAR